MRKLTDSMKDKLQPGVLKGIDACFAKYDELMLKSKNGGVVVEDCKIEQNKIRKLVDTAKMMKKAMDAMR